MRAVLADIFGSGSFGIGFELAETRDLSTGLIGDFEADGFGADGFEDADDFAETLEVFALEPLTLAGLFAAGLFAEPLAVLEVPLGFVNFALTCGLSVLGFAFDLVDAFRLSRL